MVHTCSYCPLSRRIFSPLRTLKNFLHFLSQNFPNFFILKNYCQLLLLGNSASYVSVVLYRLLSSKIWERWSWLSRLWKYTNKNCTFGNQFRLVRDKHSSLLGPFVSNKDNVGKMTLQLFSSKNKAQGPVL